MTTTIYTRAQNFIKKSNIVHNNFYDYSNINYINNSTIINIKCPIHGDFPQQPLVHSSGSGCQKCKSDKISKQRTKGFEYYIDKANKRHKNKYKYLNKCDKAKDEFKILCDKHGIFRQRVDAHISGQGCKGCANDLNVNNRFSKNMKITDINSNDICYLYNIKLFGNGETFYKWGISKDYKDRHKRITSQSGYDIEIISILVDTRYRCKLIEDKLLSKSKRRGDYTPLISFGGHRECYII